MVWALWGAIRGRTPARRQQSGIGRLVVAAALVVLAGCTPAFDFGPLARRPAADVSARSTLFTGFSAPAEAGIVGSGPVRVALLLPVSGDPAIAAVGTSMANAAKLAMSFVMTSPRLEDNITLVIRDTGATPEGAAAAVRAALAGGARLILGPLRADAVATAGAVAKADGVPLIGFSNTVRVASPGVYLLAVLPGTEIGRSLGYAKREGHHAIAALFPASPFGAAQKAAFASRTTALGVTPVATDDYANATGLRSAVARIAAAISAGTIDTLFVPDGAAAPSVAALLSADGVSPGKVLIVGSADWGGDRRILASPGLAGAIYPAVDPAGYTAMAPGYEAMFGAPPHPLATIAYTAAVLANARQLALADPPYATAMLTLPNGFSGRDGVFRFHADGRSDYALAIMQVQPGGAVKIEDAGL